MGEKCLILKGCIAINIEHFHVPFEPAALILVK